MQKILYRFPSKEIAIFSFSCALIVYEWFFYDLSTNLTSSETFIKAGLGLFLYHVIYYSSSCVVRRVQECLSKPAPPSLEERICGKWFQLFQMNGNNNDPLCLNDIRYGTVSIKLYDTYMDFVGYNHRINDSRHSQWSSNKVTVRGQKISLMYSSPGSGRDPIFGTMEFHCQIQDDKDLKSITGYFRDSSPAISYGTIELYRDEEEYKKRRKELEALCKKPIALDAPSEKNMAKVS